MHPIDCEDHFPLVSSSPSGSGSDRIRIQYVPTFFLHYNATVIKHLYGLVRKLSCDMYGIGCPLAVTVTSPRSRIGKPTENSKEYITVGNGKGVARSDWSSILQEFVKQVANFGTDDGSYYYLPSPVLGILGTKKKKKKKKTHTIDNSLYDIDCRDERVAAKRARRESHHGISNLRPQG